MRRLLFPLAFAALAALATAVHVTQLASTAPGALTALAAASPPAEPGSFPAQWIHGRECATEPPFQVHWYSENVAILRQGKCSSFEAPFLYLIFGRETILMLDTGANPTAPIDQAVQTVISGWRNRTGNQDAKLLVAHSHTHFDHIQGDAKLAAYPKLAANVGIDLNPVGFELFWGFQDYPNDVVTLDLGDRLVDVIGVPGHDPFSVALYDRETQLLLTGDIVYPGHLFLFSAPHWKDFVESIQRLVDFAAQNPVTWVVGCHIETRDTPGRPYAYGTKVQPEEHSLELPVSILTDVLRACKDQGTSPACTIYPEFVIHPVYLCGITWNG